jgi:hypothetical protein
MRKPTVTIGIAFRDPGEDFTLAIKSVFAQTFTDWELLLCDDGSADGSAAFARSLADRRVRVVSDGLCKTLAIRLNQMVSAARGDFFFRMDADDVMHPDRLCTQLNAFAHRADSVIGSSAYAIDARSHVTGLKPALRAQANGFGARHSFHHSTVAARTEWFRRNPYTEVPTFYRSEDAELWCRTRVSSRFEQLEEPLMYIREVGVFSITKYIGTAMGTMNLAQQYGRTKLDCLCLTTRELGKLWLMCALHGAGRADWVIRRRGIALDRDAVAIATRTLDAVRRTALPIDDPKVVCEEAAFCAAPGGWQ